MLLFFSFWSGCTGGTQQEVSFRAKVIDMTQNGTLVMSFMSFMLFMLAGLQALSQALNVFQQEFHHKRSSVHVMSGEALY